MDWTVEVISDRDNRTLKRLEEIEAQAFNEGGLNVWMLVPLIRHGRVYALRQAGEVMGGAQFFRDWADSGLAYLVGIAVDRRCRGQGLGTRFLAECLAALKEEGVTSVELTVDADNAPALRVYQDKLGFIVRETRKDEYGPGVDRLVMVRRL